MKRRLLNLATALSLLFCVAAVALWVRSYFVHECVMWENKHRTRAILERRPVGGKVVSGDGVLHVDVTMPQQPEPDGSAVAWQRDSLPPGQSWLWDTTWYQFPSEKPTLAERLGFSFLHSLANDDGWEGYHGVSFPLWLPAAAFAALPVARFLQRRHRAGHCTACGYDLRATPGRCPECGDTP